MTRHILAIAFIFVCTTVAWMILGGTVTHRTHEQNASLHDAVGALWGGAHVQPAPTVVRLATIGEAAEREADGQRVAETVRPEHTIAHPLDGSDVDVDLRLDHRRKGLLWYPTYEVTFRGTYVVRNPTEAAARYRIRYVFPTGASVLDDFRFVLGDADDSEATGVSGGEVVREVEIGPGEELRFGVGYRSQGVGTWRYRMGETVEDVRALRLVMHTDFAAVNFPVGTLSPTEKRRTDAGWTLTWRYARLVADAGIGIELPERLNPGPWVSRVTFFAPVSLFLFFFLLFVLAVVRGVRLHPMHYFFLGAAFFSFHLLLAYLVDHVSVHVAMGIASVASVGLVVSYMRLVTGWRFALAEVGLTQLIYLVGFAYTFFLEGYTGLTIALLSVATLFGVMQLTGRVDWETLFASPNTPAAPVPSASPTT